MQVQQVRKDVYTREEAEMNTTIQNIVTHDCDLIVEAIRRLTDGTWMLQDEDLDYAWELFPKIEEALNHHIRIEETIVFPKIDAADRGQHRMEHFCLSEKLREVGEHLERLDAQAFQTALIELQELLAHHHRDFKTEVFDQPSPGACCESFMSVFARMESRNL